MKTNIDKQQMTDAERKRLLEDVPDDDELGGED